MRAKLNVYLIWIVIEENVSVMSDPHDEMSLKPAGELITLPSDMRFYWIS